MDLNINNLFINGLKVIHGPEIYTQWYGLIYRRSRCHLLGHVKSGELFADSIDPFFLNVVVLDLT